MQFHQIKLAVIVILTQIFHLTTGTIQCYKCTTTKPSLFSNETVRLCSEFDYSDKYIVNCPFSSYCMKRYFSAKIPVPINATERDCAHQSYTTQSFKNGQWHKEILIEEPYQDGCNRVDDKGVRTSTTIDCYCKTNLCNLATINYSICLYSIVIIVVLLTVIK